MTDTIRLIGLDFGSTTSSALFAQAEVQKNFVTDRLSLGEPQIEYRSPPVFTPYSDGFIDELAIKKLLDEWFKASGWQRGEIQAGGSIITGLAARQRNSDRLSQLIEERISHCLVASTEDGHFESWLAYMGNCHKLAKQYPEKTFINFDIGGGTTNIALGQGEEVLRTAWLDQGARNLSHGSVEQFVSDLKDQLESLSGNTRPVVTYSGGVGQLIYEFSAKRSHPQDHDYQDFGVEMASHLLTDPLLSEPLSQYVPATMGRATAYGIALHNTQISGATTFVSKKIALPLKNIPILGRLKHSVQLNASPLNRPCAFWISDPPQTLSELKTFVTQLHNTLKATPLETPVVLLSSTNIAKTLGAYLSEWEDQQARAFVVIDELTFNPAQFLSIGAKLPNGIPVAFYGMS